MAAPHLATVRSLADQILTTWPDVSPVAVMEQLRHASFADVLEQERLEVLEAAVQSLIAAPQTPSAQAALRLVQHLAEETR